MEVVRVYVFDLPRREGDLLCRPLGQHPPYIIASGGGCHCEQQQERYQRRDKLPGPQQSVPDRMVSLTNQILHLSLKLRGKVMLRQFLQKITVLQTGRVQHYPAGQVVQCLICHGNPSSLVVSLWGVTARQPQNPPLL